MFSELPWKWIICCFAIFVAMKCIMSLATLLKDRLQGLLVEHVKRQQIESKKRQRISELRERIRAKKSKEALDSEAKKAA